MLYNSTLIKVVWTAAAKCTFLSPFDLDVSRFHLELQIKTPMASSSFPLFKSLNLSTIWFLKGLFFGNFTVIEFIFRSEFMQSIGIKMTSNPMTNWMLIFTNWGVNLEESLLVYTLLMKYCGGGIYNSNTPSPVQNK